MIIHKPIYPFVHEVTCHIWCRLDFSPLTVFVIKVLLDPTDIHCLTKYLNPRLTTCLHILRLISEKGELATRPSLWENSDSQNLLSEIKKKMLETQFFSENIRYTIYISKIQNIYKNKY